MASGPNEHALRMLRSIVEIPVVYACCKLGVFDAWDPDNDQPKTLEQISKSTEVHVSFLEPVLRKLVYAEVLRFDVDRSEYWSTSSSRGYRSGSDSACFFMLMFENGHENLVYLTKWLIADDNYKHSRQSVGRGSNTVVNMRSQTEGTNFFDALATDPQHAERFLNGLTNMDYFHPFHLGMDEIASHILDTEPNKRDRPALVDVGGGNGHFLLLFLEANGEVSPKTVYLQDLNYAINVARRSKLPEIGVNLQEHNFFDPQPIEGAKAYYIRACLHDWPDDHCTVILRHLAKAMSPDSRLFIAENIKSKDACSNTSDMDILMIPVSGCERTKTEFESLLYRSGLRLDRVVRKPQGDWAIMVVRLADEVR
ncbi:hypothetical protein KC367_g8879 [Hortaea werneckii]|nr:hypothetical protein KC367_g8879 [Hortaea werneckii]